MKILVATEKPFAKVASDGIREIAKKAGHTVSFLEKYTDKAQFLEAVADVDALIVRSDKVTKEVVDAAKNLKIVVRAGAGYDSIDLEACSARKIVVMNTPGQNSNAVAELVIGMMIAISRNCFTPGTGCEIHGKKLGVHAYGNVGKLVAKYGRAMGMDVYAFDPFITDKAVYEKDGVKMAASPEELYSTCQYVSLHLPSTEQTRKSINYALLSKMPKGAVLLNTARKDVIDEDDLQKILAERADFKYATDIAPACKDGICSAYGTRVFSTPKKMGAETAEANINAARAAASQIVGYFENGCTKFQVNKF